MRGKAGTAHPGRTAAQRRVLDQIGRGNYSPIMAPSTRDAMLLAGLIVHVGPAEFAMPLPVHMRWRAAIGRTVSG